MQASKSNEAINQAAKIVFFAITRDHLQEILEIEKLSFNDANTWNAEDFVNHLRFNRNITGIMAWIEKTIVAFYLYELQDNHIRLLNMAVHPDFRKQGIGTQCILKLKERLREKREYIEALLPDECASAEPFFKRFEVRVRRTNKKGELFYKPVLSPMTVTDWSAVDEMERTMAKGERDARNIPEPGIGGIVVYDDITKMLMGFALFEDSSNGIVLDGQCGIIVGPAYRKRGIGRQMMQAIVSKAFPHKVTFKNVWLNNRDQCAFLRAVGAPVPEIQEFADVTWNPIQVKQ